MLFGWTWLASSSFFLAVLLDGRMNQRAAKKRSVHLGTKLGLWKGVMDWSVECSTAWSAELLFHSLTHSLTRFTPDQPS